MKRMAIFGALVLALAVPVPVLAQGGSPAAAHKISGVMDGTFTFVPFDSSDLSDLYAIHSVGVSTGRLKSLGFCNLFTVQKPMPGGAVIDGHVWIVTPSGDRLVGRYVGTTVMVAVPPALFFLGNADFVISGGSGRFVNAKGTIHGTALLTFLGFDVWSWPVSWMLDGTVTY